jgi:hypothetical protein
VLRWEKGRSASSRYWISNLGQLIEVTDQGKVSFVLLRGGSAYVWDAGAKEGVSGPAAAGGNVTPDPNALHLLLILPELFRPGNFRFAGYEKIEGVRTVEYEVAFKDPRLRTQVSARIWVLPDRLFPVRFVNSGFGGHYGIENSRIVIDPKLPDQLFSPPSDVRFRTLRPEKKG